LLLLLRLLLLLLPAGVDWLLAHCRSIRHFLEDMDHSTTRL
jgi:hypothetical protein